MKEYDNFDNNDESLHDDSPIEDMAASLLLLSEKFTVTSTKKSVNSSKK